MIIEEVVKYAEPNTRYHYTQVVKTLDNRYYKLNCFYILSSKNFKSMTIDRIQDTICYLTLKHINGRIFNPKCYNVEMILEEEVMFTILSHT